MVIEYMANGTVYSWIRDDAKDFTDTDMLSFATDCATGMEYLHSNDVLQRDLKPVR